MNITSFQFSPVRIQNISSIEFPKLLKLPLGVFPSLSTNFLPQNCIPIREYRNVSKNISKPRLAIDLIDWITVTSSVRSVFHDFTNLNTLRSLNDLSTVIPQDWITSENSMIPNMTTIPSNMLNPSFRQILTPSAYSLRIISHKKMNVKTVFPISRQ